MIVGAGRSGRSLLRELRETPGERVVGFLDDDPLLRGQRLHGVRVLGGTAQSASALARTRADAVVVTIGGAPPERLAEVLSASEEAGVPVQFVRRALSDAPPPLVQAPSR